MKTPLTVPMVRCHGYQKKRVSCSSDGDSIHGRMDLVRSPKPSGQVSAGEAICASEAQIPPYPRYPESLDEAPGTQAPHVAVHSRPQVGIYVYKVSVLTTKTRTLAVTKTISC